MRYNVIFGCKVNKNRTNSKNILNILTLSIAYGGKMVFFFGRYRKK